MATERVGDMRRLWTWLTLAGMISSLMATAAPAVAADDFDPGTIVFPVIGDVYYSDTFGAPRSGGRTHEGTDIMSVDQVKGRPVVAAADGVVNWIGSSCCYLSIDHGGGWETWYIHLDNDTPGTDDGLGWGIAPGIERGVEVVKGQLIGWLGDSGNAEWTAPHLHFEIRRDGAAINSYPYLIEAPVLDQPGLFSWNGAFWDDDDSVHEANIDAMFAAGITRGCNPPANDRYCPGEQLTRGQVAAFLRRNLDLPFVEEDYFTDDDESIFEDDINALAAAGIAFGCTETEYCTPNPLTRGEMAEFLVRAYGYVDSGDGDYFADDDDSPYAAAIDALFSAGITVGCDVDDPSRFCPTASLTRAQMATFLARATGLGS